MVVIAISHSDTQIQGAFCHHLCWDNLAAEFLPFLGPAGVSRRDFQLATLVLPQPGVWRCNQVPQDFSESSSSLEFFQSFEENVRTASLLLVKYISL